MKKPKSRMNEMQFLEIRKEVESSIELWETQMNGVWNSCKKSVRVPQTENKLNEN